MQDIATINLHVASYVIFTVSMLTVGSYPEAYMHIRYIALPADKLHGVHNDIAD